MKSINHPNIIEIIDFFIEKDYYYVVLELAEGGELFDRIIAREYYSEKDARDVVSIFVNAIKFCHDRDIVHRDLKPENLLLASTDEDTNIKIADFGFATKSKSHDLNGYMGTRGYMAPEILEHKDYGKEVDMWSIGVITFILLCGYPPFSDDSNEEVKQADFTFLPKYWKNVSDDAKDFIKSLIVVDPDRRLTAKQALEHKWLMIDHEILSSNTLDNTLEELRNYQKFKKFRVAAKVVGVVKKMKNKLLQHLQKARDNINKRKSEETEENNDNIAKKASNKTSTPKSNSSTPSKKRKIT